MKRLLQNTLISLLCLLGLSLQSVAFDILGDKAFITESPARQYTDLTGAEEWLLYDNQSRGADKALWIRFPVTIHYIEEEQSPRMPLALMVRLYASYDFYWDGLLVGSNRELGTSAPFYSRVLISIQGLTPGHHEIMLRAMPEGRPVGSPLNLLIQPAAVKADFFGIHPSVILILFVGTCSLLLAAFFLLTLKNSDRQRLHILAGVLSILPGCIILLDNGIYLFGFSYTNIDMVTSVVQFFTTTFVVLLPLYIIARFAPKHRLLTYGLLFLVLALGAKYAPASSKHWFFFGLTLTLGIELVLDIRHRDKERVRLALQAQRLQADLLKKNIQPHFLMNSLTALMEWVDLDQTAAVDFIDALATEFRILSDFSNKNLVTSKEEFDLCRAHLRIMEKRYLGSFTLEVKGFTGAEIVPPAIFHTLIENAFTHNHYERQDINFTISLDANNCTISVSVPVMNPRDSQLKTGSGTSYITARLEECYGRQACFTSEQSETNWISTIHIPSGLSYAY